MIVKCLSIENKALTAGAKYGKHKIPRYLYHMTNKTNYESMLADGLLKTGQDQLFGKGVFATELTNLFKRWRKHSDWNFDLLQDELIKNSGKGENDIILLKIPTAKLKHDLLRVRSQNTLLFWQDSQPIIELSIKISKEMNKLPQKSNNWLGKFSSEIKKQLNYPDRKTANHILEGAPAKYSNLYKQRKKAIEYIYKENIPMENVEKIGEVNLAELRLSPQYDSKRPIRSIFCALLKGRPEIIGAKFLNC